MLLVTMPPTTVNVNHVFLQGLRRGLGPDIVRLPELWPVWVVLAAAIVLLVLLKGHQGRSYSAHPARVETSGPAQCETCGRSVSANDRKYCKGQAATFEGQVLCYEHQRPYLQRTLGGHEHVLSQAWGRWQGPFGPGGSERGSECGES